MFEGIQKTKEELQAFLHLQRKQTLYSQVFNTPAGREVLQDIMDFVGLHRSAFDKDPITMARKVSKQEVGHYILRTLKIPIEDLYSPLSSGDQQ